MFCFICLQRISVGIIGGSTFLFCLCWQFNQFILLLQALALVAAFLTHLLPQHKVIHIYSSNNNIDSLDIRQQLMSLCDLAKIMRPANQEFEGGIKQKKLMF